MYPPFICKFIQLVDPIYIYTYTFKDFFSLASVWVLLKLDRLNPPTTTPSHFFIFLKTQNRQYRITVMDIPFLWSRLNGSHKFKEESENFSISWRLFSKLIGCICFIIVNCVYLLDGKNFRLESPPSRPKNIDIHINSHTTHIYVHINLSVLSKGCVWADNRQQSH